jgi:thiol-disulfide isomerase/thioredoxin
MLRSLVVILYTSLLLGANAAHADMAAADAARTGDMRKLALHETPVDLPEIAVLDETDAPRRLAEWKGQWVVLNFWATWCAPCREEMPSLDRLEAAMGDDFSVVTIATGRNSVENIDKFFAEAGVTALPKLRDPKSELARNMGVLGLPLTVILNPDGQEVARLIGDAEWDSADAKAVLAAMMAGN